MTSQKTQIPAEWKNHDQQIRPYLWSHRVLTIGRTLLSLCLTFYLVFSLRALKLELLLAEKIASPFLLWLAYFGVLLGAWELISMPFSVGHHWIERAHKLSKQTYLSWFWDKVKGWLIGVVLGTLMMGILYLCIHYSPQFWWAWSAALFILLSIVLAQLAPILLIPLFFKLKPMEPTPLKERLLNLCKKFDVHVEEVFHLGMGEKTEKGNAAFVGLGKTKRIMIGDTLYEKFAPEQVEAVFAHELGHQVHNDLWKGIILSSVTLFLGFYVTERLAVGWLLPLFETDIERAYGLFLFFVLFSVVQIPVGFLQTCFSRWRERMADQFALDKIGSGEMLASALEKLTYQNRGLFKPNGIVEFFTYSHPAPWRRITQLRR